MATSTDYWLQGMQVADSEHKNYLDNQQKNRDYLTKNKLYYGEDWVGDEKGNTDFRASENARKARMAEDAAAAAQVYLEGSKASPFKEDPRPVEGTTLSDYGAPSSSSLNPDAQPDAPRLVPVTNLGAPSATPAAPVRVIAPPQLVNTDSVGGDYGTSPAPVGYSGYRNQPQVEPQVQPDAPRYIPIQGELGSPPASPAITAPVNVAPAITQDFGQSLAPAAPVAPRSPVPNTATYGAPTAASMPTAQQVYDRVSPEIQKNPAFLHELTKYEQNRLAQSARFNQAEEVAKIRAEAVKEGNTIKRDALEFKKTLDSQRSHVSYNPDGSVAATEVKLANGAVIGHMVPGGNGLPKFERLSKLDKGVTEPELSRYIKSGESALLITGDAALSPEQRAQTMANITAARATRDSLVNPNAPKVVPVITQPSKWNPLGSPTTNYVPPTALPPAASPSSKRTKEDVVKEYKANPTPQNWDKAQAELKSLGIK